MLMKDSSAWVWECAFFGKTMTVKSPLLITPAPLHMPSFPTHRNWMTRRWPSETSRMVPAETRSATTRFVSVDNRPCQMGCSFSGLTRVVSTDQVAPSCLKPSTPCFTGTKMHKYVMCIFPTLHGAVARRMLTFHRGCHPSERVDGSLVPGHSRNFLLPNLSYSFLQMGDV